MRSLLFWLVILFTNSFAAHLLTLDEALQAALKHSPHIEYARLAIEHAKREHNYAEGAYLPMVDLEIQATKDYSYAAVDARELLYDFGKRAAASKAASWEIALQKAHLVASKQRVLYRVKQAFYELLKAKSEILLAKKEIALQKEQLRQAKRYFKAGIRTLIDVSDAKVHLASAKLALRRSLYRYSQKKAKLEQVVGRAPFGGDYEVEGVLELGEDLVLDLPKLTLEACVAQAFAKRPKIQAARQSIAKSQELVQSHKASNYPRVWLSLRYVEREGGEVELASSPKSGLDGLLFLDWRLFEGYRQRARIEQAKIAHRRSEVMLEAVRLDIKQEVMDAYLELKQAVDSFEMSSELVALNLKRYTQAKRRYEYGLADYIELQNARQGYLRALQERVAAYYDYYIAEARLEYSMGALAIKEQ